jgi:hypothetical protein
MSDNKYPKYEECKKCNYYEDDGLYETCLWFCRINEQKLKERASKVFTNNRDAQIAFRKLCEMKAYQKGYKEGVKKE